MSAAPPDDSLWVSIADRLRVPSTTVALLWDMDGVLLDTLTLDFDVVGNLLKRYMPNHPGVSRSFIRSIFANDPEEFWRRILTKSAVAFSTSTFDRLVGDYEDLRRVATPPCNPGIREILNDARSLGMKMAVVSNNPEADVRRMLSNVNIVDAFGDVVGNDRPGLRKKPAPDSYIEAARQLDVPPAYSAVIEDSLLGLQAGRAAGCYTIGVATGSSSLDEFRASELADASYESFAAALTSAKVIQQ